MFDKDMYWARRRNKSEMRTVSGRKVLVDRPLRGQGDTIKRRGKLVPSPDNRAQRRASMKAAGLFKIKAAV